VNRHTTYFCFFKTRILKNKINNSGKERDPIQFAYNGFLFPLDDVDHCLYIQTSPDQSHHNNMPTVNSLRISIRTHTGSYHHYALPVPTPHHHIAWRKFYILHKPKRTSPSEYVSNDTLALSHTITGTYIYITYPSTVLVCYRLLLSSSLERR
jgi:hypothetical protein